MNTSFSILVNYTQVVVFCPGTAQGGLLWSDDHVAQGFACSHGVACFGVPDHDDECLIEVETEADALTVDASFDASLWVIAVPFETDGSEIRIGTLFDDKPFTPSSGLYRLVFQAFPGRIENSETYSYVLRFNFIPSDHVEFEILKQGSLESDKVLLTTAKTA